MGVERKSLFGFIIINFHVNYLVKFDYMVEFR